MIPIDPELNLVSFWNIMQDFEYERQNEIQYPMDTTLSWRRYTSGFAYIACISLKDCFVFVIFLKQIDFAKYVCFIWEECNGILFPLQFSIAYW
jgi:hypothetical protein